MSEKKSFALRIDSETMKAIEKWASDEFRSVNGQIEWMLHNSLKNAKRVKEKKDQKNKESND
ncbi:Arc family DNA binding domain-containing protein [Flavobacterium aquicola]|uniref:Arc-like DNA binding domain-containing protein n=1 Tax=Flavobacterium aquicola TaxID=1682742 RepID=A0A3E0ENE4_9FLAO|nr:Arc family DNA binding domain-containing protein [Flavobacterium aquicola]REG98666.1 hypothetical protein C8P67_106280 [Flavobacterium aquicola]